MFAVPDGLRLGLACGALVIGALWLTGLDVVFAAEELSAEDIIKALRPTDRVVRSLTSPAESARAAAEARFVDTLRNRGPWSLTTDEREKIASIIRKRPSVDLEVNFEYNSATIGSKAMPQVTALGQALSSGKLKGGTFFIAGHTDAKGSETYNQGLSERRADAMRSFLSEKYDIDPRNLVTVGYGKAMLKNPSVPFSVENRRVQVVNIADY